MDKEEIVQRLAETSGLTKSEAADHLDRTVNEILRKLRSGTPASLPGLGEFTWNKKQGIRFHKEHHKERPRDK